jgi:hypothetical protein
MSEKTDSRPGLNTADLSTASVGDRAKQIYTIVLWQIIVVSTAAMVIDGLALWHLGSSLGSIPAHATPYMLFGCDILALALVGRFLHARASLRGRGWPVGRQLLALLCLGVLNAATAIVAGIE